MNLNSRKFRRLNMKSSFNRRCCRCFLNCFWNLGSESLPALLKICLFGCLACVRAFVVCHLSKRPKHFSTLHSVVIVCVGDTRLLFKFLLKFGNVLKHTESRGSLACNQNIKENISATLEVFLCFEIKRNEATYMSTDPSRKLPRNLRRNWVQFLKIT